MANSSDFRDDDATLPGAALAQAAGLEPTLMAVGAEPAAGLAEIPVASLADTVDAALSPEELAALEAPPLPELEASADELPTLRRPPGAVELGYESTERRSGRTWAFGDGVTLDAENVGSQRVVGASALDALLADIERSFAGAADSVTPGPLIGHANRFQLTSRLGHGGMGVVFRAFDHELRRYIAIKLLAPSQLGLSEGGVDHFLRNEARAIAALSHPNIVQVFDISSWCEVPFLVMEYLEGRSLDELPAEPMAVPRVLAIADQLLSALEHAHEQGVIHRDLKPSNLFETARGELKILDFGIASLGDHSPREGKLLRSSEDSAVAAAISGTPGYMSPEQWISPVQDERTDLWAVGVLLVGMLTGRPLFAERGASEVRAEVLSERPTLVERDYRIPRPLFRVLEKALEKDPARRYQTAASLRHALNDAGVALGHGGRARPALAPEQRQVTLVAAHLSIDAVGDFETAAEILRTWHNTVGAIVQRAGGFVMTSAGASVVACFGYPVALEDDAVRAVSVACAIRDTSAELLRPGGRRAKVRVGVDTGLGVIEEVPVSAGGVPLFQGPAAQGVVALRERAEVGQVVIGAATAELVRGYFIVAEGAGGAGAFVVTSARAVASRFDASLQEAAPLVGREEELELQDRLWHEASAGRGSVYCLVGDAGVGKSRLVHRLRQRVIAEGGVVLTGQCWSQTAQSPFHPLIALLRQALELDASPGAPVERVAAQLARLQRSLTRLGLEQPRDAAVLAAVLGLPAPEGAPAPAESAEALRRAIIDRATVLFERLAARTPVAILIEDLHWADHSTLDFLDHLLPRVGSCRVVLALTSRREAEPFWRQRAQCHERELAGLPPEVARELVCHLHSKLGHAAPSAELVDEIVAKSSGLPLYLEELTRAYAQRSAPAEGAVAPPATLLGLLGARLDQASAAARAAAQLGAVLGRDFRLELLEPLVIEQPLVGEGRERSGPIALSGRASTASGAPLVELESALAELCERGIIQPAPSAQGLAYVFRHALMHDVAYQAMPPEQRRARHAQVAELLVRWSEQPDAARAEPLSIGAELVAYHYDQAGRAEVAVKYWERAGQADAKKWAVKEAVGHLSRALVLLETLPEAPERAELELRLLLALGPPLMSVQGYAAPRVEDTYARAYELCIRQGRHAQTFPPLVGLWQYNMVGGNLDKAAVLGARLLTLADAVGDSTMRLIAMRAVGTTRFLQGDLGAAIEHTSAGWKLYDRAAHGELAFRHGNDPGVGHGIYLAWALWQAGRPDQALTQAEATLALARSLAHPMSIAFSLCYSAIIRNLRGEHLEAEELLAEALVVADENQLGLWKALALIQRGWAVAARGDATGVDTMTTAIAAWRQTGARAGTTFFYVVLGQLQQLHGQREAAAASYQTAESLVQQNGEHFYEPELGRAKAGLLDPATQEPQISALLDGALAQAVQRDARSWELRLRSSRLELARAVGSARVAEVRGELAACLAAFTEGRATADLRHAAALLERAEG